MNTLCWIRRDLRLQDHPALKAALDAGKTTIVFIFDSQILNRLSNSHDRRVTFIFQSLEEMEKEVQKYGSSIIIRYGDPVKEIPKLAEELNISGVYCNRDYEPYAKTRDQRIQKKLGELGIEFHQFKDTVLYEKHEVLTHAGEQYKVFTPYKNRWLEHFEDDGRIAPFYECHLQNLKPFKNSKNILNFNWYNEIGFIETFPLLTGGTGEAMKRLRHFEEGIEHYKKDRDYPALDGTSLLSVYIRFGNISIREMIRTAVHDPNEGAKSWLNEIIWRDFYQMILDTYPHVEKSAFKPEYNKIKWPGEARHFKAWCEGETGFPLIDAAMRCFNQTGMMHNRLRMVVASFLCKTLLIDWRKGEAYFAEKLLDYDLAANNGGWQWSSSSGCDAWPYFRIFNPYTQSEKFDQNGDFIRAWIPELAHLKAGDIHHPSLVQAPDYPSPIVNYETNRRRCLDIYSVVKSAKITH